MLWHWHLRAFGCSFKKKNYLDTVNQLNLKFKKKIVTSKPDIKTSIAY